MNLEQVLREIRNMPVGCIISDEAAESILWWYRDYFATEVIFKDGSIYKEASDYERLCIDHLRAWMINKANKEKVNV